ncbi:hypothetical protein MMPV_004525 [Pyropia vietnamensis]
MAALPWSAPLRPPPFDLPATVVAAAASFAAYGSPPSTWRWNRLRLDGAADGEGVVEAEPTRPTRDGGDSSGGGGSNGGGSDGSSDGGGGNGGSDDAGNGDGISQSWRVDRATPATLCGEHGWGGRSRAGAEASSGEVSGSEAATEAAATRNIATDGAPGDSTRGSPSASASVAAATAAVVGRASRARPLVSDAERPPASLGKHTHGRTAGEVPRDNDGGRDSQGDWGCERRDAYAGDTHRPTFPVVPPLADAICLNAATGFPQKATWSALVAKAAALPVASGALGDWPSSPPRRRLVSVAFLESRSTATQGWVWVDAGRQEVVIAFRGTEGARWKDLLTDTMAWWVPFAPGESVQLDGKEAWRGGALHLPPVAVVPTAIAAAVTAAVTALDSGDAGVGNCLAAAAAAMQSPYGRRAPRDADSGRSSSAPADTCRDSGATPSAGATTIAADETSGRFTGGTEGCRSSPPAKGDGGSVCSGDDMDEEGGGNSAHDIGDGDHVDNDSSPMVHFGFLRAWLSVRESVLAELARWTHGFSQSWTLTCTGHSLGGALATLCAADVRVRYPAIPVSLVTFGQPRVGNAAWAAAVDELCPHAMRVIHDGDAIALCPTGDYCHSGRTVRVNEWGRLVVDGVDGAGDGTEGVAEQKRHGGRDEGGDGGGRRVGEGQGGASQGEDGAVTRTSEAGAAGALSTACVVPTVTDEEVWASLNSDGESLWHHVEDVYLASLSQCVEQVLEEQGTLTEGGVGHVKHWHGQ